MTFTLSSTQADDIVVARVHGELDRGTAEALRSHASGWIDRGERRILIDCSALSSLDLFGLGVLIRCSRASSLLGGWMRLCKVSIALLRLQAITGLAQALVSEDEIPELMADGEPSAPASDACR